MLNARMISGERAIEPDDETKIQMVRDGETRLVVTLKLCLDGTGTPTAGMLQWRFRPFS